MPATFRLVDALLFERREQPWRQLALPWRGPQPVPSMMAPDELAFLHYLAHVHYRGNGSIVDLGPLAGGSTYALAAGMRETAFRIHSFDLWRAWPECSAYFPGWNLKPGNDLLPAFLQNLGPFASRVVPHKGDILAQHWHEGPVEIMFIDAAKSPALMLHIIREFYPRLTPGAYIVHQDYISSECPWIHIAERELREYFQVCDSPTGGSVCFRLIKPFPSRAALPHDYFDRLSLRRTRELFDAAVQLFPDCWERLCVQLAWAQYLLNAGLFEEAKSVYDAVLGNPAVECEGARNDLRYLSTKIAARLI